MPAKPHHSVVAGVLFNEEGKVLLASRPADKSFAGYWEFPGGKIEAGEQAFAALARELNEETALIVHAAHPWLCWENERADARISLQFWRIAAGEWSGTLTAREGQTFAWQQPAAPTVAPLLPNNAPVLRALAIPTRLFGDPVSGLHDHTGKWHALPATRHHLDQSAALLLDADDLTTVKANTPFWAVVRHRTQFLRVADAAAVIWAGDAAALATLLDEGVSLPVFALTGDATQTALPTTAGLHGFIDLTSTTEQA